MAAAIRTVIAVPARYGSTRLPGKPLLDVGGEPMIARVWRNCRAVRDVERVIVATDDERVRDVLVPLGAEVRMTSGEHRSGTDRIAEAVGGIDCDLVVNVQGDEPFLEPAAVEDLVEYFVAGGTAPAATLAAPLIEAAALFDPGTVKVVIRRDGSAMYFSRLPVPYRRQLWEMGEAASGGGGERTVPRKWGYLRHTGVYAFRPDFLRALTSLEATPAEEAESLEQLRILEHGERIHVLVRPHTGFGIDTPEDLERARKMAGG